MYIHRQGAEAVVLRRRFVFGTCSPFMPKSLNQATFCRRAEAENSWSPLRAMVKAPSRGIVLCVCIYVYVFVCIGVCMSLCMSIQMCMHEICIRICSLLQGVRHGAPEVGPWLLWVDLSLGLRFGPIVSATDPCCKAQDGPPNAPFATCRPTWENHNIFLIQPTFYRLQNG